MADFTAHAGQLRTRITFQQPTVAQGTDGAQVPSWSNVATNPTVWSHWVHDHGQEALQSDAGKSVERATVTVRYRSDIKASWAILDPNSSRWQIISAPENVQNLNRWTVFRVERVKGTV
jgi:SPP1 family predicted phage head-tail adaptor